MQKIICSKCGQEISKSNFTKHLRRHDNHPETFIHPYTLNHDGLVCQYCGKACKNRKSICNHERLCSKNPNRQEIIKSNFNKKGRTAWNKGLTKETNSSVAQGAENRKISKAKGLHKLRKNPMDNPEIRKKISESCLKRSKEGTWHTSLAKNMHINYHNVDLHGKYELAYAKFLDREGIKWERCKDRFEYIYKDSIHYYTPDFYLIDRKEYIEIKGYASDKDYAKWMQFPKNKLFKVLMKKDLILLGIDPKELT